MQSFQSLAEEDSNSSANSEDLTTTQNLLQISHQGRAVETKHANLSNRLRNLKSQVTWHEQEISRLRTEQANEEHIPEGSDTQSFVKALLGSNDGAIYKQLSDQERERQAWEQEDENMQYKIYYPVRTGKRSADLLGLFHSLTFMPIGVNVESRSVHRSEFRGLCSTKNESKLVRLFTFRVNLRVNVQEQSVDSFNITVSPWVMADIGKYLFFQKNNRDIYRAMHGLAKYGNIAVKRHGIFSQLASKYQLENNLWRRSSRLIFAEQANIQLTLIWNISIPIDTDEPVSHVSVSLNQHISNLPKSLQNIPTVFDSLLKKEGVLKATQMIHEVVYGLAGGRSVSRSVSP